MAYIEMNGKMRILVADADAVNAQAIRQYLKRIGYTNAVHQPNGYEAMHAIRTRQADFVLCRMSLPIMDGPTVFEEMKSDFSLERVPFAIFEERMSPEDVALVTEYGVDGTLSLPFVQKDLAELLAKTWARYIDKKNPEYLFEQARRLFAQNQVDDAAKIFEALLARGVHPERSLVGLGLVATRKGNLGDALSHAEHVVGEYPDYVRGHHLMGEVQLAMGSPVDAIESFSRAIQLSPKNPYRYEVVCDLLGQLSLWSEAENLYRKAIGMGLDFPRLKSGLASALANLGRRDEAIALYEELVRKNPKNAAYLNNIAACYKNGGNLKLAVENYRRALDLEPTNTRIMYNLALLLLAEGNRAQAQELLAKALKLDPKYEKARAKLEELEGRRAPASEGRQAPASQATSDDGEGKAPLPELSAPDLARLQKLMKGVQKAAFEKQKATIEMPEAERKLILGAPPPQLRTFFHSLATRMRRMLVELVDSYANLVATLSGEVVEILGEITQKADAETGSKGFSESTMLILTALQFQDELTQLLNGFRVSYRSIAEKGVSPTNADFQKAVKSFNVETMRKKLVAVATTVVRAPRDPFREKGLVMVEAFEIFGLDLLEDLAKRIQDSHDSLERAVDGFRAGKASEESVTVLEGIAHHFVILATRLQSLREILELVVGCWLHADCDATARQGLLLFGKDMRGLWPKLEAICQTPEERELLTQARLKFNPSA